MFGCKLVNQVSSVSFWSLSVECVRHVAESQLISCPVFLWCWCLVRCGLMFSKSPRCNDCNGTYIGEYGRTLTTRLGEHQTATDKEDLTNNIAQHHRKTGNDINWDSTFHCYKFTPLLRKDNETEGENSETAEPP